MSEHLLIIGSRHIGRGYPCYIVAEAGVNHNGDVNIAHDLIDAAHAAGADAVKFQCFVSEALISMDAEKAPYQKRGSDDIETQYEMLKTLELNEQQLRSLNRHCGKIGIQFLCTPYDTQSVAVLERIGVAAYKVASTDTDNLPFLRHLAAKKRPIILSTGMATMDEITQSLASVAEAGNSTIALLHCTSQYPTPLGELNIRAIGTLREAFKIPVGFSDHSMGIEAAQWAVSAGACIIEKHFTIDRNMVGPDHAASIEPEELSCLVKTIRRVETALGDGTKRVLPCEVENRRAMRKSVVAARDIRAGAILGDDDLCTKRPGLGLPPCWLDRLVGGVALKAIRCGDVIARDAIDFSEQS